jgi:hypothetical protein
MLKKLVKARERWDHISRILRREGVNSMILAIFYKAIVQRVLLFGSQSWVLTPNMLKKMEGFHRQIARWLTGRTSVYLQLEGMWE